ncbi:hypothetical protein HaLaN_28786 [Haematococcus lacustris]|uniref:Uncharacterized protein n=1 Tax=Haematococcus lacustris TaxID=44745 RepID=A0A6A0ADS4_HAELA|nr:hypothetical protein HaLaN_28786 [Haematococcus lacustris]
MEALAALLAAETLAKQSVVLPALAFDTSKWSKKLAMRLPLRSLEAHKASGSSSEDSAVHVAAPGAQHGDVIRGLMCSTSTGTRFYDRDVSAALNIRRIAAGPGRPRELSSWLGRPAIPNPEACCGSGSGSVMP